MSCNLTSRCFLWMMPIPPPPPAGRGRWTNSKPTGVMSFFPALSLSSLPNHVSVTATRSKLFATLDNGCLISKGTAIDGRLKQITPSQCRHVLAWYKNQFPGRSCIIQTGLNLVVCAFFITISGTVHCWIYRCNPVPVRSPNRNYVFLTVRFKCAVLFSPIWSNCWRPNFTTVSFTVYAVCTNLSEDSDKSGISEVS